LTDEFLETQKATMIKSQGYTLRAVFPTKKIMAAWICAAASAICAAAAAAAAAPTYTVLYRFNGGHDGGYPIAPLVMDGAGAIYGTTTHGGLGNGTVFRLTPPATGTALSLDSLYEFRWFAHGWYPAGLFFDSASGSLYGTTLFGGRCLANNGCGSAFSLSTPKPGHTVLDFTELYRFGPSLTGPDVPFSPLVADSGGALYGMSEAGVGPQPTYGSIYRLSPPSEPGALWSETVIYNFAGGSDGSAGDQALTVDTSGAIYGTAGGGVGSCYQGCGTVFKLTPPTGNETAWIKTTLYEFKGGSDGSGPTGPLLPDGQGGFYGTTGYISGLCVGTYPGCGTVFRLTPPSGSQTQWAHSVLYTFKGGNDGAGPGGPIALDPSGAIYGATALGGSSGHDGYGWGTVFKLTPPQLGGTVWTENLLHIFKGGAVGDGGLPYGGILLDGAGVIYGATEVGGHRQLNFQRLPGNGILFRITR
jgi:uncharacterized protein YceK